MKLDFQLLRNMEDQAFRIAVDLWVSIVVILSQNMIKGMQDNIEIYKGRCRKCDICTAFCPKGVLEIGDDGYPFVKDFERCNSLGRSLGKAR